MELSALPALDETLVEFCETEEGAHFFIYPFAGRLVHEGLAVLLALRFARARAASFAISMNDYGIELMAERGFPFADLLVPEVFSRARMAEDLLEAVNLGELSRRQFRDVARVAGLVFQKYPGAERSGRQVQAGAGLIFDVLREFDPGNLLLRQSEREVIERQFEGGRLAATLERLERGPIRAVRPVRPTPLGLPLVADRLGTTLSTEGVLARIEAILRGPAAR
jgi:ATP-dependent Lhr-like helicase